MRSYFEYCFKPGCGLPGVTLLGTQEEWDLLATTWARLPEVLRLDELCRAEHEGGAAADPHAHGALRDWMQRSAAVLRQLQATRAGAADVAWWTRIVHAQQRTVMMGSMSNNVGFFSGWLAELVLYTADGGLASLPLRWRDFPSSLAGVPVSTDNTKALVIAGMPGFTMIAPPAVGAGGAAEAVRAAVGRSTAQQQATVPAVHRDLAAAPSEAAGNGAVWGIAAVAAWAVIDEAGVVAK